MRAATDVPTMVLGELVAKYLEIETEECFACHGSGKRGAPNAGAALKKIRLDSGISLSRLARELDCSPGYVCDVEKGTRRASIAFCEAFLRACKEGARA